MPQSPEELRNAVLREIEAAFGGVSRVGGISLHEAAALENYASPCEQSAARSLDTESHWPDVPAGDIRAHPSALRFLDPLGYRYYLPAYMIWSLLNHNSPRDTSSVDATIASLTRDPDEKFEEWELDPFKMFTAEQASAIRAFLSYFAAHGHGSRAQDAREAIQRYWERSDA